MGGELVEHFDLFEHFEHFEHSKHLEHFVPPQFAIDEAQKPPSEDVPPIVPCGHLARRDRLEHPKKPKNSRKNKSDFFFSYQSVRVRLVQ